MLLFDGLLRSEVVTVGLDTFLVCGAEYASLIRFHGPLTPLCIRLVLAQVDIGGLLSVIFINSGGSVVRTPRKQGVLIILWATHIEAMVGRGGLMLKVCTPGLASHCFRAEIVVHDMVRVCHSCTCSIG